MDLTVTEGSRETRTEPTILKWGSVRRWFDRSPTTSTGETITRPPDHVGRQPRRGAEIDWVQSRPNVLEAYRGQWVAIVGEDVVANDVDLMRLYQAVEDRDDDPLLFQVPSNLEKWDHLVA